MVRFDENSGQLYVTELGRVASHYYIKHDTILVFNKLLKKSMTEQDILKMLSQSSEFESMVVREDELLELDQMLLDSCPYGMNGAVEDPCSKANVLMQVQTATKQFLPDASADCY